MVTWQDLEGKTWAQLEAEGKTWKSLEELVPSYIEAAALVKVQLEDLKEREKNAKGFKVHVYKEQRKQLNATLKQLRLVRRVCETYYTQPRPREFSL